MTEYCFGENCHNDLPSSKNSFGEEEIKGEKVPMRMKTVVNSKRRCFNYGVTVKNEITLTTHYYSAFKRI